MGQSVTIRCSSNISVVSGTLSTMKITIALILTASLLGVSVSKPFAGDSKYASLLRNLHRRSAQLSGYGRPSGGGGGGSQSAAPACRQVPRQECNNVPRQECSNVPRQQCNNVPRQQCNNVPRQECRNVPSQECN